MSIKKKLGLGVASAALGLSLVGGGTFAYFNDTATINNAFAAGTLDLQVTDVQNEAINFDLSNLKPGDTMTRRFYIKNNGSLAIKDVLLDGRADSFVDGNSTSDSNLADFLSQFTVDVLRKQNSYSGNANSIVQSGAELTLYELISGDTATLNAHLLPGHVVDGRVNLASPVGTNGEGGLTADPVDFDYVQFTITFKDDGTNQNEYQGDSAKFYFDLEARQWDGVNITHDDPNGWVNNGKEVSGDGTNQPDPITGGTSGNNVTEDVTDAADNPNE
jgi:spore coat-associated protein N